ncbi:DUF5668 domain-containing protein [uncultured Thermanaerothrix sp.]|uniref:LiaI-LiaF-like domain-containing protein n=1 Tax=uncultured Thermanaerothrix sp. TaxID=1195149 RepID=UPI0026051ADC|nr:DUF5668 domain-containing protein [uncultured Thermanaerothrix sp.]
MMKGRRLFWGSALLLLGVLLLLENLGLLPFSAWAFFWPLALIWLGIWLLLRPRARLEALSRTITIPLGNAREAHLRLDHGAGRLVLHALEDAGTLFLRGECGGGVPEVRREGERLDVRLRLEPDAMLLPWVEGSEGYRWALAVTPHLPLDLECHLGANQAHLDLSRLHVRHLILETGASETTLILPAQGQGSAHLKSGVAALKIQVPPTMAARIHVQSGLAGVNVDAQRFPYAGEVYESPDYATATNRFEIHVETGLGSVEIS